ncbi:MAG: protein kinase domain-containing protein [Longimicrobiales bacterium]
MDQLRRIGQALSGHYVVERELGRGGTAVVYLARDLRHERNVAIKVLLPELSSSIGADRFRREIAIAARLNHPHIVAVFDSGNAAGLLYYVMPYIDGLTLRDELDRVGPFPLDRAVRIAREVADGLEYAHAAGVIHRDIKPRNILLSGNHALIADFGIARALQEATGSELTSSGLAIGTPAYMSPEQANGEPSIDARSDIYALGCVLYEMVAGEPPFRARSAQGVLGLHMMRPPPSLSDARAGVPVELDHAVRRALAKTPDDRFSSASEFGRRLDEVEEASRDTLTSLLRRTRRRFAGLSPRARLLLPLAALVLVLATAAVVSMVMTSAQPWPGGRPASVVVLPYHYPSSTEAERLITPDIAAAITNEIDAWESIRSVPPVALGGPMFDLGITGPTLGRLDDGRRLAREFDVHSYLAVTVRLRGDSAVVEASLFDAESGRVVGRPYRASGSPDATEPLARRIAAALVGVTDVLGDGPRPLSSNPQALRADAQGRAQLERWRLRAAETSFRSAIGLDSTFALAHHRLAQTLYWQASEGRAPSAGSDIAFHSAAALRHGVNLSTHDSLHVRAFYALQDEEYDTARRDYRSLVRLDPNDVYAWLFLGTVEYVDPWLSSSDPDIARPRADYNLAIRAFTEAVRLQPTFELGYGHLFDIYRDITPRGTSGCQYFQMPASVRFDRSDITHLDQMRPFCPVMSNDSIVWLAAADLETHGIEPAAAGAELLFSESMRLLRRWADYSRDQPKPANELAEQILAQRARLGIAPPERIDSLAAEALTWTRRALDVSSDTLPIDLIRLGNLYLGVDSIRRGLELVEMGLARHSARGGSTSDPALSLALNAFTATGRIAPALLLASATGVTRAISDPASGNTILYGGAEPIVERLRVLGANQISGIALRDELRDLDQIWAVPPYTRQERMVLRREAALRIAPALLLDSAALSRWNDDLEYDDPLWQALVLAGSDPAAASLALERSRSDSTPGLGEFSRSFLHGVIAASLGDHAAAVADFTRLDSIPLALDRPDINWGLRWTARLRRAASFVALGNASFALNDFEGFIRTWAGADSLAAPLVEYAQGQVVRLRENR